MSLSLSFSACSPTPKLGIRTHAYTYYTPTARVDLASLCLFCRLRAGLDNLSQNCLCLVSQTCHPKTSIQVSVLSRSNYLASKRHTRGRTAGHTRMARQRHQSGVLQGLQCLSRLVWFLGGREN